MIKIDTIFVIIDPTTDKQYALQRAVRIARVTRGKVHAYLCIQPSLETHDPEALERVERERYSAWVDSLIAEYSDENIEITTELEFSKDWRKSLGDAANRVNSNLILKSSRRHTTKERLLMTSSDTALLESANCSVIFVSSEVKQGVLKVLAAVDINREHDEKYKKISDGVMAFANAAVESHDEAELHIIYSYSSSENFRHVTDVAQHVGIDSDFVHINGNELEVAIAEEADKIDADLIVIGLSTRSTLSNRIFGGRVDKLINNINRDILVVIPSE